jgi:RimJ/RimL family protein N-acetyltransferase
MIDSMEIKALGPSDAHLAKELVSLGAASWAVTLSQAQIEERAVKLAQEITSADQAARAIFVAVMSGRLVGACRVAQDRKDASQWLLLGLAVHPDHRRQGFATALVKACIDYARERGASAIRSETHVENRASIRLHESIGFENVGPFTAADGDKKIAFRMVLS